MGALASTCKSTCDSSAATADAMVNTEIYGGPPDLFVDVVAEATYALDRSTMQLSRDNIVIGKVSKADYDGNIIKVTGGASGFSGYSGFEDDQLFRSSGPYTEWADDWFSIAASCSRELGKEDYRSELGGRRAVHIKGFSSGLATVYDANIVERLKKFEVLAWDGADYDSAGVTRLVPLYLSAVPRGVAVAFKRRYEIPRFNQRWYSWMAKHPGRIVVVAVDVDQDAKAMEVSAEVATYCRVPSESQRRSFLLARIAFKTTGAAEVVALGGEGTVGWEAQASFPDDVHWTVYAVSRGQREQRPSLCDFARKTLTKRSNGTHINLVMGRDPNESDAFSRQF
mmetsp:Transcript_115585/g.307334  ORF Transcript_115585/g.307334 Transcript_115585/m.307334 type:complete len:340 (-) Transcript_115585:80-1099(-)